MTDQSNRRCFRQLKKETVVAVRKRSEAETIIMECFQHALAEELSPLESTIVELNQRLKALEDKRADLSVLESNALTKLSKYLDKYG